VHTTKEIVDILRNINDKLGITIVFITHQLEVAKQLFHRIAVINDGIIIEENTAYDVFSNPKHELTKKLVKNEMKIPKPVLNGVNGHVLTLVYKGGTSLEPIISEVNKKYNVVLNILHGNIEYIQKKPIGILVISVEGEEKEKALDYLISNVGQVYNFIERKEEAV